MSAARVVPVSVSAGGVPKTAVSRARVTLMGLKGDRHRDTGHHGGPERAVSTSPCANIASAFLHRDVSRVSQKRHPGWSRVYPRVPVEGTVGLGDPVRLLGEAEVTAMLPRGTP